MNLKKGRNSTLAGRWEGSFEFQDQKTNLAVDFKTKTISIPQQGVQGYPIENFSFDAPAAETILPPAEAPLLRRGIGGFFQARSWP